MKKNAKMLEVEKTFGEPLEVFLPLLLNNLDQNVVANKLGISRNTLANWTLRLGLRHIWIGPESPVI